MNALNNSIKRLLVRCAYVGRHTIRGRTSKRMLLGFANAINCPAVTINRTRAPDFTFRENLKTNMDWLAWVELSGLGAVTRVPRALMGHRVHAQSATSHCIESGSRRAEDRLVLEMMWPRSIAAVIMRLYERAYTGYMP